MSTGDKIALSIFIIILVGLALTMNNLISKIQSPEVNMTKVNELRDEIRDHMQDNSADCVVKRIEDINFVGCKYADNGGDELLVFTINNSVIIDKNGTIYKPTFRLENFRIETSNKEADFFANGISEIHIGRHDKSVGSLITYISK